MSYFWPTFRKPGLEKPLEFRWRWRADSCLCTACLQGFTMKRIESSIAIFRNSVCQHLKRAQTLWYSPPPLSPRPSSPTHEKGIKNKSDPSQSMVGKQNLCRDIIHAFFFVVIAWTWSLAIYNIRPSFWGTLSEIPNSKLPTRYLYLELSHRVYDQTHYYNIFLPPQLCFFGFKSLMLEIAV